MRSVFFVCVGVLLATAGCKGKCRQLSEKLCECTVNTTDKDSCLRIASASEGTPPYNRRQVTPDDEAACAALLDKCDCRLVDTPQGKINCGLARPLK